MQKYIYLLCLLPFIVTDASNPPPRHAAIRLPFVEYFCSAIRHYNAVGRVYFVQSVLSWTGLLK